MICGKRGIRTLVTLARKTVFETVPFNRSGIFPLVRRRKTTAANWRRARDSNPRNAFDVYTLSRRAP